MAHPVFLSYARSASRSHAQAVYNALGGADEDLAFLDTEDIEHGEHFPERIVDALWDARVVVIFAEPVYFTRWYCLLEFRLACTPFLRSTEPPAASLETHERMLAPLVLALPSSGAPPELDRFPSLIRATQWPSVQDPDAVAALVRERLQCSTASVGDLLEQLGCSAVRSELLGETRVPPPQPLGGIPLVPLQIRPSIQDAFVGRADDLWRIDDLLMTQSGGGTVTAALTGAIEGGGGVGKTRLALEYLHRFGPKHFPRGLFWIDADVEPGSLEARHHEILQTLDPSVPTLAEYRKPDQPRNIASDLRTAVSQLPKNTPALFVVDNVPEPEAEHPPKSLIEWCPVVGLTPVLATSRNRISLGESGTVAPLRIDVLDEDDAVMLLTRSMASGVLTEEQWREIVRWVGHLPLALELLNALLCVGGISAAALLEKTRTHDTTHMLDGAMEALRNVVPAGALRGVSEAFLTSYQRLNETEQEAARLLAWLAPEPIPEVLIEALGQNPFSSATRATLVFRSFVAPVTPGGVPVFGAMHRVLAEFIRTQSAAPADEHAIVAKAILSVMTDERCRDPREWPVMNLLLPHALAIFHHRESVRGPADCSDWYADLGLLPATLSSAQGDYAGAGALQEQVLETCRSVLGEEHPDTLSAMDHLASSLQSQGDLSGARALRERVVEGFRRSKGDEHPFTLSTVHQLATVLFASGDLAGAAELQEEVLNVRLRANGEEDPNTIAAMVNYALTLEAQGKRDEASALRLRALELAECVFPHDAPDMLMVKLTRADELRKQGDLTGARVLQEQVLGVSRDLFGAQHPATLSAKSHLARTVGEQGDLVKALELEQSVFEERRLKYGEEHPDTLMALSNLAVTRMRQGEFDVAQPLLKRVLAARRRVLGEEHPDVDAAMHNLANSLYPQRDFAGARPILENLVAVRSRTLGADHINTYFAKVMLAYTMWEQGAHPDALALEEEVLNVFRERLGEHDPATLACMRNLALARRTLGDLEGAESLENELHEVESQAMLEGVDQT